MKFFNATTFLSAIVAAAFLAACSAASEKTDKKAELKAQIEKLKGEQSKINGELKSLEAEYAKETGEADSIKGKEIAVATVTPRKFDYHVQTQGSIESIENIQVSAKTAGIITQVFVVEGETVSKGQTLAQIDNSLTLRGIEEVKSNLELANTVYERQKNLWDKKIGTEVQYLQAKTSKESLERRLASLNEQNEMTKIKSPINGVVDEVTLRVGQNIAPGMPAARVINNLDLKVKANVSEAYISKVKKGNKVIVTVPDLGKDIPATVTFVGRNINQLSRTFVVEVKLPSSQDLRPNMTVVLRVIFESFDNAIVVPVNLIQEINGQKILYVAESQGGQKVARRKVVEVSAVYDNLAQIKSGLKPGDEIITVGYQGLNDGEYVKL